mmetsp:Transcript_48979/g.138525  ORF Transcript_48979/g.138525 Transcript_48979/m.138525 type:complete len:265 (-) Transcript_48979:552-1346(-)
MATPHGWIRAAVPRGRPRWLICTCSTEHVFADDLTMGATIKNNAIDTIYAKFHESFGDIIINMRPKDSKVTGSIDMKSGDARCVASFDKDELSFLTKVALTSDKMKFGPLSAVMKPTYDAINQLLDLDVCTNIEGADVTMSMSQRKNTASTMTAIYKFNNGVKVTASAAANADMSLKCEGDYNGHKLDGTMAMQGLKTPGLKLGWAKGHGAKGKASTAVKADMSQIEGSLTAKLGNFGDWTTTLTTPYSDVKDTKFALSTKFDV